jgi:hypothetical protein
MSKAEKKLGNGTAIIANVTVEGKLDFEIVEKEPMITLEGGEEFGVNIPADTDVSGWFTNLPWGLTALVAEEVELGTDEITITLKGTPLNISSTNIAVTIPGNVLSSGESIHVTDNPDAVYAITAADWAAYPPGNETVMAISDPAMSSAGKFTGENPLGNLICDAVVWYLKYRHPVPMQPDFVVVNGGLERGSEEKLGDGDITYPHLLDTDVTGVMKGDKILIVTADTEDVQAFFDSLASGQALASTGHDSGLKEICQVSESVWVKFWTSGGGPAGNEPHADVTINKQPLSSRSSWTFGLMSYQANMYLGFTPKTSYNTVVTFQESLAQYIWGWRREDEVSNIDDIPGETGKRIELDPNRFTPPAGIQFFSMAADGDQRSETTFLWMWFTEDISNLALSDLTVNTGNTSAVVKSLWSMGMGTGIYRLFVDMSGQGKQSGSITVTVTLPDGSLLSRTAEVYVKAAGKK